MLTMIAKFELAVRVRQYNRHAVKKLNVKSVYGLRFCKPAMQAQLLEACALLDFRSHQREHWSFDHIAVCLQVILPWLQKTVRDAQADLANAKKRKKLPDTILREADLYVQTLSRCLITVSDRLEEVALSYVRSWLMGSHQRLMNTSPAFFEELANTKFAKHRVSRECLNKTDDQRLPIVFRHVWEGLQSKHVSGYTYESLFELTPIKEHREAVFTVSQKRASVARENSLTYLLPVSLQSPSFPSWFWRTALARFLFPDRYACATFARTHAYAISLLFADLPGLYLRHKGLLPAQEPVWKRIVAQAEAVKAMIQSVDETIQRSSRVKYRSHRLLHELKRLLQVKAHKIEVHKVKFTRRVQRGDQRPRLNPAIRPKQVAVVNQALGYLDQAVRTHHAQCQTLHQARLNMIKLGEQFYAPSYGAAARQLASEAPSRFCEFHLDQCHEEMHYAQLWIDQVRQSVQDTQAQFAQYQEYLADEKSYHALLVDAWSQLTPSLLTLGHPNRHTIVQQLKLQFNHPTPWYTSDHVIKLIDQLLDADTLWAQAERTLARLVHITEHPQAGLPYLHLINGHPLLRELIQEWDTHPDAHHEQLRDVARRLSHMQPDFTLDFVPYVMSVLHAESHAAFETLMQTLGIERKTDETPEQQAYRALMQCRSWQRAPEKYPEQQAILTSIDAQLQTYHAQLKNAVEALNGCCLSPEELIQQLHETVFSHLPEGLRPTELRAIQAAVDEQKADWAVQQKQLMHLKELQQLQAHTLQPSSGALEDAHAADKEEAPEETEDVEDVEDIEDARKTAFAPDLNTLFLMLKDRWCQTQLTHILLHFFTEEEIQHLFKGKLDLNQQPHVVRQRWCRALHIALQQIEKNTDANQRQLDRITDKLKTFEVQEAKKQEVLAQLKTGLDLFEDEDAQPFFIPAFEAWAHGKLSVQEQAHVLTRYQHTLKTTLRHHNTAVATLKGAAQSMQTLLPHIDIHQLDEARQRQLDRMVNKSIEYTESPRIVCDLPDRRLPAMRDTQQHQTFIAAPQLAQADRHPVDAHSDSFEGVFVQLGQ